MRENSRFIKDECSFLERERQRWGNRQAGRIEIVSMYVRLPIRTIIAVHFTQ
jgi:hypothetical protein